MPNDSEAEKAIEELNGATVLGRTIVVNRSEPRPQNDRRTGGNRNFSRDNNRGGGGGYRGGNNRGGY